MAWFPSFSSCKTPNCSTLQSCAAQDTCSSQSGPAPVTRGPDAEEFLEESVIIDLTHHRHADDVLSCKAVLRTFRAVLPVTIWKSPSDSDEAVGGLYCREEVHVKSVVSNADGKMYFELADGRGWLDAEEEALVDISAEILEGMSDDMQKETAEKAMELTLDHVLHPIDGGDPVTLHDLLVRAHPGKHQHVPGGAEDEVLGIKKKDVLNRYFELHHMFEISEPHSHSDLHKACPDKSKGRVSLETALKRVSPAALLAVHDDDVDWHQVREKLRQKELTAHAVEGYDKTVKEATHLSQRDLNKSLSEMKHTVAERHDHHKGVCNGCGNRKGRSCEPREVCQWPKL